MKWSIQAMSFPPNPFHANYILNVYNMSYMYLNKYCLNQPHPWLSMYIQCLLLNEKESLITNDYHCGETNCTGYDPNTVKPVLRGHPEEDKNWLLKTGDPLIQIHLHYILVRGNQKIWLLKTGDPLIEVTTWAGLTVYWFRRENNVLLILIDNHFARNGCLKKYCNGCYINTHFRSLLIKFV